MHNVFKFILLAGESYEHGIYSLIFLHTDKYAVFMN